MMPAIRKAFDLRNDDIVEFSTENETLKSQVGDYDENWLAESKAKLLKHVNDQRANLIMSRMQIRWKNIK